MAKRSLFSILSEQPWWVSLLVAMALFAVVQLVLPPLAPFIALPFIVLAAYVGWKQLRGTSPVKVEEQLGALRGMPWDDFRLIVSEAYRRHANVLMTHRPSLTPASTERQMLRRWARGPAEPWRRVLPWDLISGIGATSGVSSTVMPDGTEGGSLPRDFLKS